MMKLTHARALVRKLLECRQKREKAEAEAARLERELCRHIEDLARAEEARGGEDESEGER